MKRKFRVILPFELDGELMEHGSIVHLDSDTAAVFSHALIAVDEEEITA